MARDLARGDPGVYRNIETADIALIWWGCGDMQERHEFPYDVEVRTDAAVIYRDPTQRQETDP